MAYIIQLREQRPMDMGMVDNFWKDHEIHLDENNAKARLEYLESINTKGTVRIVTTYGKY